MGKKRVILADTEENVLSALEIKFLYELDESVELEIITDARYFEELFSKPQNVDVLVCGESLFDLELKKHNIQDVFLLTESVEESGTADELMVKKIFKYSSPQEIMNQVIYGSSGDLKNIKKLTKEPILVLVYSASGGTGKTTVAMGVCGSLVKSYNKVLYINAERINSFHRWLNNTASVPNSIASELATAKDDVFHRIRHAIRTEKFDYFPPLPFALSSLNLDVSIYEKLAISAKASGNYDVIVVDTDSVFDSAKATLITKADRVLMIVNQSKSAVLAMNELVRNMNCNDNEKFFFVCNGFDPQKSNALVEESIQTRFIVSEYIGYIKDIDSLMPAHLAGRADVQKTAALVM